MNWAIFVVGIMLLMFISKEKRKGLVYKKLNCKTLCSWMFCIFSARELMYKWHKSANRNLSCVLNHGRCFFFLVLNVQRIITARRRVGGWAGLPGATPTLKEARRGGEGGGRGGTGSSCTRRGDLQPRWTTRPPGLYR